MLIQNFLEGFLNSDTIIVSLCCLFWVIIFFVFKPQLAILLNRLAKFELGGAKNLQHIDQDFEPESPTSSSPVLTILTKEKIAVRIAIFVILSYLIYVVPASLSRMLIEFGNSEYSTGNEKIGTVSYSLALELNNSLKKVISQCYTDNAQKQYELAISDCSKAIEIDPNYVNAYSYRALAYSNLKKYDQAIADYTKGIELVPTIMLSYINRGIMYSNQNKYDLAIADLTKAIDINPKEPLAYLNRGFAYASKGNSDLAMIDCNKARELGEKGWDMYYCLGFVFNAQQKYDLALTNINEAIELSPSELGPYLTRGSIYGAQQKNDLAIFDYTKVIEIDPNYKLAYFYRGTIYAAQKNYDLAISDFGKAIEIDPNYVDPYVLRGNAFADTQKFSQAITDYQKALSISATSYTYCVQGITYTKMNEFKSAITSLEQGVKLDIKNENNWCKSALENARIGIPTP